MYRYVHNIYSSDRAEDKDEEILAPISHCRPSIPHTVYSVGIVVWMDLILGIWYVPASPSETLACVKRKNATISEGNEKNNIE